MILKDRCIFRLSVAIMPLVMQLVAARPCHLCSAGVVLFVRRRPTFPIHEFWEIENGC